MVGMLLAELVTTSAQVAGTRTRLELIAPETVGG